MRLLLFGEVAVRQADGQLTVVGGARVRALLALLALQPGTAVPVERLIDTLWEEEPPANAINALQTLVKRLRHALGGDAVVRREGGYVLTLAPEDVDVVRFDRLVAAGRTAMADGDAAGALVSLRSALSLWRDPVPPELSAYLNEKRLAAVEDCAEAHLRLGRSAEMVNELAAMAAVNPLRERLCALYLRALAANGRQAEALELYRRTRRLLAEELGVDPAAVLVEAHAEVLRAGQVKTNLRSQLTSFVGREEEIARIGGLLAESRLVTLVGAGGAGKTRLAVEGGMRLAERWPDGVWLVELARVSDQEAVPYAMLAALEIGESGLEDPLGQIASVLAGKRLLLIVDNCEHILDTAATLIDGVLARCPGVEALATSREPLGITGETLCRVPPLTVPAKGATTDSPAVRLFTDRARSVRPGFAVEAGNREVVGAICRRLDGLPLAIELAAARLRALTPEQVVDRLDDRFRLLTGGNRAALPRHQTLRAVVEWSWSLLTGAERRLAVHLSVFAGGATLDSAEGVCGGDVMDDLLSLVDKSLVEVEGGRFTMLETIRAYGAEQLDDEEVARGHARHFLELAETAVPRLRTAEQLEWVRRLADEHDNCVAALGWAVEAKESELALRLCGALTWYWQFRGRRAEALHWSRQVLALAGDRPPAGLMGAYLACEYAAGLPEFVGMVGFEEVDLPERFSQQLETAFAEGDVHPIFQILAARGGALESADPWLANTALLMRGTARMNASLHDLAAEDLQAAVSGFRRLGERRGLSRALLTLATFRARQEGSDSVKALMEEAAGLAAEWVSVGESVSTLTRLAHLQAWDGDLDGSAKSVARARARITLAVPAEVLTQLRLTEADLVRRRGGVSVPVYAKVLADMESDEHSVPLDLVFARTSYALALVAGGDVNGAYAQLTTALDLALTVPDTPVLISVSVGYAVAVLAAGDAESAATIIEAGAPHHDAARRGGFDVARTRAGALAVLGEKRYGELAERALAMPLEELIVLLRSAGSG